MEREKAIDKGENNALPRPTMNGFHNCIAEFRESRVSLSHARVYMNRSEILCVAQFGFRDGAAVDTAPSLLPRLKNESSS